jgi:hypothetical protein
MLDEGFWAEIRVGGEHLRLFSERNALGVQTSVYNVNTPLLLSLCGNTFGDGNTFEAA